MQVVGKLYKIISSENTNDKVYYYGSTTFIFLNIQLLLNRVRCNKDCKLGKRSWYQSSFDILKYGDYKIEMVEDVVGRPM